MSQDPRKPPHPLDYGARQFAPSGLGCGAVLAFAAGCFCGSLIVLVLGAVGLLNSPQQSTAMHTFVVYSLIPTALMTILVLLLAGRRGLAPFSMGLIVGACGIALLEGICFGAFAGGSGI